MANILLPKEISYAPTAFQNLRGLFCLYKPPHKGFRATEHAFRQKITQELNSMECRPPREMIKITGDIVAPSGAANDADHALNVELVTNLADHPLVSGPRYDESHLRIRLLHNIGWYGSGVTLGLIGSEAAKRGSYRLRFPRIYELRGEFGLASDNFRDDGKVRIKSTYKHVERHVYERVLAKIEAVQRANSFKMLGIDLRSEEAYQIALRGVTLPPKTETAPIMYALRSIRFDPPNFAIQLQCYNEQETFLAELINEIGLALRTTARCTGIRLMQYGPFTCEHALLQKHWTLENLIENIYQCNQLVEQYKLRRINNNNNNNNRGRES